MAFSTNVFAWQDVVPCVSELDYAPRHPAGTGADCKSDMVRARAIGRIYMNRAVREDMNGDLVFLACDEANPIGNLLVAVLHTLAHRSKSPAAESHPRNLDYMLDDLFGLLQPHQCEQPG